MTDPRRMAPRGTGGFTLIEMLVVLVQASLLSGLLMYAISYVLTLEERLAGHRQWYRVDRLREAWFSQSIAGILLLPGDSNSAFSGKSKSINCRTLNPLTGFGGVPTGTRWWLEESTDRVSLKLQEAGQQELLIGQWQAEGRFRYLDDQGNWRDEWSLLAADQGKQLPLAILFQLRGSDMSMQWLVPVTGVTGVRRYLQLDPEG
jgi:prepilin-type N-terminal cleavage/methylation domain-containing protein